MERLAASDVELHVQVFFGTWCSFCNRFLPNTLRVEEELRKRGGRVGFEFHGLPPPPATWAMKEAAEHKIRWLPTALVYSGGEQIGRLEGNDFVRPEAALVKLLK